MEGSRDSDHRHRDHAGPDGAAFDVVQVVRGIDEHAAHRRADDARADVGRVGRRELGGPPGRDRATGIADQADLLCSCRSAGGRAEHRTQRIERVHPVLRARREICRLALGVGHHDGLPREQRGRDQARLRSRDQAAQRDPAGDGVRRLVFGIERVVEGLVGDDRGSAEAQRRLQHRGHVDRRRSRLTRRSIEQLHRFDRQRHARHMVGERPRLQHSAWRDVRQRRGAFVGVEGILFRRHRRARCRRRQRHEDHEQADRENARSQFHPWPDHKTHQIHLYPVDATGNPLKAGRVSAASPAASGRRTSTLKPPSVLALDRRSCPGGREQPLPRSRAPAHARRRRVPCRRAGTPA